MSRAIVERVTLIRASLPADKPHPPFVSFARKRAGKRIVDIGGGKGAHITELAQDGHECVCIDTDLDFLKEAKRAGIAVIQMDAHALGFRTDTFDTALMFELIEHVRNPKQVLAEARRVVTGNVLITTPCHDYSDSLYSLGLFVEGCLPLEHLNFYKTGDLKELIRSQFPACTIVKDEPMFLPGFAEPLYYSRLYAEAFTENVLNQVPEIQQTPAMLDDLNEFLRIAERLHLLEEQNSKLASEYAMKINTISTLEERLHLLEEQNSIAQKALNEIRNSFGYKFMRFYASRIDRLLPDDTRRGRFKRTLVTLVRIGANRGIRSLIMRAREKRQEGELYALGPSTPDPDYAYWIARNEPRDADLNGQRRAAKALQYRPLISIITPVWNPPPKILADTMESVLSQTYDNWELIMADGASQEDVRSVLREFARRDRRIKVRFLESNLGISENSNMAIEWALGEFIALLDHDDMLAPFALYEVAKCLNRMPECDFIYSDKDSMTAEGNRFNPLLKPDWSPDMMLSANYLTHLCVIRTGLVRQLGGFRPETDGAQDWDLFLRVNERTSRIFHIPRILYHWRQVPQSVSSAGLQAKPYVLKAQVLTLNQYLARNNHEGTIECDDSGRFRVKWSPSRWPRVSIIVYSDEEDTDLTLRRCLGSIFCNSSYRDFEVIVVHNNRHLSALEREFKDARFPRSDRPLSYASGNNFGADNATGDILVFLDPSTEVSTVDWLQELAGWALQPEIGIVGAKLLSPDRRILHGGIVIGLRGYIFDGASERSWSSYGDTEWYRDYSAVCGSCMTTSKKLFDELGGFKETLLGAPDVDLCLRSRRRGYRIIYTPFVKLILHRPQNHSARTILPPDPPERSEAFAAGDPYFNPNLSYKSTTPRLKTKPEPNET
jgi:GT2 family glycosyltransferase/SAM-dependent methyltransferase